MVEKEGGRESCCQRLPEWARVLKGKLAISNDSRTTEGSLAKALQANQ